MNTHPGNQPLQSALVHLETTLDTPIVPGELPGWLDAVIVAHEAVSQRLEHHVRRAHVEQFETMTREDPGLFRRRKNLESTDSENIARSDTFRAALMKLKQSADDAGADEKQVMAAAEKLMQAGLRLVVEVRKQEVAIQTWLSEAVHRDRGTVD